MTAGGRYVQEHIALRSEDRRDLHQAANIARRRYPDPVGELVARELDSWREFGYRFDRRGITGRLVKYLLDQA